MIGYVLRVRGLAFKLMLLLALLPVAGWADGISGTVVEVKDGDTFVLSSGEQVRLLDINTPEGPHDGAAAEPLADVAGARLRELVLGNSVNMVMGSKERDKYGRRLAHVYDAQGRWVNGLLVREGLAVVYTFADNRARPDELLTLEREARLAKRGIWALPRWQVREATACCAGGDVGRFGLVEGVVVNSGRDKDSVYLNFGPDYRTDFTVRVRDKDVKYFKERGIAEVGAFYVGKKVRVHGFLDPVYGVMVGVTHPEQMEVLDDKGSAVPYEKLIAGGQVKKTEKVCTTTVKEIKEPKETKAKKPRKPRRKCKEYYPVGYKKEKDDNDGGE